MKEMYEGLGKLVNKLLEVLKFALTYRAIFSLSSVL